MKYNLSYAKIIFYLLGSLASNIIPLKWLINLSGVHYILPFYHTVADVAPPHIKHLYPVRSRQRFNEDLEFFLKHFEPVIPEQWLEKLRSDGTRPKPHFLVSFDDGFATFKTDAFPIMKKYNLPAICFINTSFLDNKEIFYRCKASYLKERLTPLRKQNLNKIRIKELDNIDYLHRHELERVASENQIDMTAYFSKAKIYLSTDDVIELKNQGIYFGGHSKDHPLYQNLSLEEQLKQTLESVEEMASKTGCNLKLFSFPFTDDGVSLSFFERISSVVDLSFGTAGIKIDEVKFNLQRIPMEVGNYSAAAIVYGEYLYFLVKKLFGRHIIRRK